MAYFYRRWETQRSRFGDLVVLTFLIVQSLDGIFTYLGVSFWGLEIEANPIVSSTVGIFGLAGGLAAMKLVAAAFGMVLHLNRLHNAVAILTAVYFLTAILPWTAIFLTN